MDNWILAQAHRQDAVGALARLWVSMGPLSDKEPLAQWLKCRKEGEILRLTVEQAEAEFEAARADLAKGKRTPTFPFSFFRIQDDAVKKTFHRDHPEISGSDYLHIKHLELQKQLKNLKVLYLDVFHWVKLRHVVLKTREKSSLYEEILLQLRACVARGKLICPASLPMLEELMKQKDSETRMATAELMDDLGQGICLQSPREIQKVEIRREIAKSLFGTGAPTFEEWVWTKSTFIICEKLPISSAFSPEEVIYIQKCFLDHTWDMLMSDLIETLPLEEFPRQDYCSLASAHNIDAKSYKARPKSFGEVLQQEKALIWHTQFKHHFLEIAQEFHEKHPAECQALVQRGGNLREFDPKVLASLQILAGIYSRFIMEDRNVDQSDLEDAAHAALAIPYCDAYTCDRSMAHQLRTKPLNFDSVYKLKILATAEELLEYLCSLPRN